MSVGVVSTVSAEQFWQMSVQNSLIPMPAMVHAAVTIVVVAVVVAVVAAVTIVVVVVVVVVARTL